MATSNPGNPKRGESDEKVDEKILEIYAIVNELHRHLGTHPGSEVGGRPFDAPGTFLGYQPYTAGVFGSSPMYSTQSALPVDFSMAQMPLMPFGLTPATPPPGVGPGTRFVPF